MSIANLSLQNVQPKAGTFSGETQPSGKPAEPSPPLGGGGPASGLISLLPLLMFIPLLFIMFRKQGKEADARKKLKKGDKVVTNGGLIGELVEMDERLAKVRIAPGTTVQVLSPTVSPFAGEPDKASS